MDELVDEEEYVFLIGFNQGIIPKLYKDEEYITDNIKNEIDVETTLEKNNISKNDTLELINKIKNIFITYKTHNGSLSYSISNISEEMNYNLIKDYRDGFEEEIVKEEMTDYFNDFDYVVGDWTYSKVRLKGFYDKTNKKVKNLNNYENVEKYLVENCAPNARYFILKKIS